MDDNARESIKALIRVGLEFAIGDAMEDASVYATDDEQEDGTYYKIFHQLVKEILTEYAALGD